MNFAPFAKPRSGSAAGASAGSRENEPERGGKTIRAGREAGRAAALPAHPQRILTSFTPALTSHQSSSGPAGMLPAQVRGWTKADEEAAPNTNVHQVGIKG